MIPAPPQRPSAAVIPETLVLIIGGAVWALSSAWWPNVPAFLPWDFSWIEYLGIVLPLVWYVRGLLETPVADTPHWLRRTAFLLGITLVYAMVQTGFANDARHMFLLNRIQQAVMHHIGPFLLALSWPGATLARGAPRIVVRLAGSRPVTLILRVLLHPLVAAPLFVALIWLWLQPAIQARMLDSPALYVAMNLSMVIDGLIFWCLVLDPRPAPPAYHNYIVRLLTTLAVIFPQLILGARLTFATAPLYPYYDLHGRLFPWVSALLDQHLGGVVVWVPSSLMCSIAFMLILNNLRLNEDRQSGGKTRDDIEIAPGVRLSSTSWTGR